MGTYVIGDIHGHALLLDHLLQQFERDLEPNDTIVFVGDYVDRGPDSRGVIERILQLRADHANVVTLKGNHEQWMMDALHDPSSTSWLFAMEGFSTIQSYSAEAAASIQESLSSRYRGSRQMPLPYDEFFHDAMPDSHLDFFGNLQLLHWEPDLLVAHAGINPNKPLDKQTEKDLLWSDPKQLLFDWHGPQTVVAGHRPSHKIDADYFGRPYLAKHVVYLDTAAGLGGPLTGIRFPDRQVFQAMW